jgi:2-haloacid dehalogenase
LAALAKHYRLAVISNIDDDLFAYSAPKLGVKFDVVVTAQQAAGYKPALRNFHMALERLGLDAGQVLHAGQSIYHDAIPAKSLGMQTVWVNRPSRREGVGAVKRVEGKADLQVRSLAELVAAVTP